MERGRAGKPPLLGRSAPQLRAHAACKNFVVAPQVWGPAEVCMWGVRASRRAAAALSGPRWSSPEAASKEKGKREEGARVGWGDQPSWSCLSVVRSLLA